MFDCEYVSVLKEARRSAMIHFGPPYIRALAFGLQSRGRFVFCTRDICTSRMHRCSRVWTSADFFDCFRSSRATTGTLAQHGHLAKTPVHGIIAPP